MSSPSSTRSLPSSPPSSGRLATTASWSPAKTAVNVVAYARSLLPAQDAPVVDAMLALCGATAGLYDAVLYARDTFDPHQPGDALRARVAGQQAGIDVVLRETAIEAGITLIDIPRGLATRDRVRWVSEYLAEAGVLPH